MEAIIHCYKFESNQSTDRFLLHKELEAKKLHLMSGWSGNDGKDYDFYHKHILPFDGKAIPLNPEHLFNDQWNTGPLPTAPEGVRVHDWSEPYRPYSYQTKYGYWLELDDEALALRKATYKCKYCGHMTQDPGDGFCHKCLGSEYLEEKDLHLLRMVSLAKPWGEKREKLTSEERAILYPLYLEAQGRVNGAKAEALRGEITAKRDKAIMLANEEHDGFKWLLDNGIKSDNVLYYSHSRTFSFGWRGNGIHKGVVEQLRASLEGFPFSFEIKER
jgi:hypothetical protein